MQRNSKIAIIAGLIATIGLTGAAVAAKQYREGRGGWGHHGGMGHGGMMSPSVLLERYDANKDGKLMQDEITAGRTAALTSADGDKNATVSIEEYKALWLAENNQRLVRDFQRLDADGNGQVTMDEYQKPTSALVAMLDSNNDGALTADDHGPEHRRGKGRHGQGHEGDGNEGQENGDNN